MAPALPLLLLALAAPVPKPDREAEFKATFGEFTDPTKKHAHEFDGSKLVVRLGETPGDTPGKKSAPALNHPHTLRTVKGDFEVSAVVSYLLPKEYPSDFVDNLGRFAAAGLYVWEDAKTHVILRQEQYPYDLEGKTRWDPHFSSVFEGPNGGSVYKGENRPEAEGSCIHLKLSRKKDVVSSAYSVGGKEWRTLYSQKMPLPDAVQVGVFAYQTLGKPVDVTFEGFAVMQGK